MSHMVKRFDRNKRGRDFAVGDIHGHFTKLQAALKKAGFSPEEGDRLFSVGDLVDRGPESHTALEWLAKPWFHAVRGNHEDIAIRYAKGNPVDPESYSVNGGSWFMALDEARQKAFGAAFDRLPYAIEVETAAGIVGLVHANVPTNDWAQLAGMLKSSRRSRDQTIWDRARIQSLNAEPVANVRAVVVGHTPLEIVRVLGNVYHIDTAGWRSEGRFTLLDLATLQAA